MASHLLGWLRKLRQTLILVHLLRGSRVQGKVQCSCCCTCYDEEVSRTMN